MAADRRAGLCDGLWMGAAAIVLLIVAGAFAAPQTIKPGEIWPDDRGKHVQAHGGGIIKIGDTYYWFGEDRSQGLDPNLRYVSCYSSKGLAHWVFRNQVVKVSDPENLGWRWVLERPKVFYNLKTKKYVMYMHIDDGRYALARVGVAVCDTVDGNYQYVKSFRPLGCESRDIGQFIDDDGSAYLIFEDRPARGFHIAKLSEDYLNVEKDVCLIKAPLEGGAVVHYKGLYYAIGSALTGWRPNPNKYATAPALAGPWSEFKDIAPPETNTYGSQSTMMLKVVGTKATTVIFMGDMWRPRTQWDSRYLWMPLEIGDGTLRLPEPKEWTLDIETGEAAIVGATDESAGLGKIAPKPLFRDPVYDGAADPVVIWNQLENKWFMFYTNRRANLPVSEVNGVSWVHGTKIGIAESADGGATWKYRGTAGITHGGDGMTYWAPEVIEHGGTYHMYLTFVPGIFSNWQHPRDIVHLTSKDLLTWDYQSTLKLSSERVIDACVVQLADGTWRLWYNNEADRKSIYFADSKDLYRWEDRGKVDGVNSRPGEGPKVVRWKGCYWMVVDIWKGLGVYRSDDALKWTQQASDLLQVPGKGQDDQVIGGHPDMVVSGERAFIFYFTHPGRTSRGLPDDYETRRSSIQVVELQYKDGVLSCDRDTPTHILLAPPAGAK